MFHGSARCLSLALLAGCAAAVPAAGVTVETQTASELAVFGVKAEPAVFSDKGYEADRAAARESGKLHLVYATATWCPPCKRMKTTTWVDDGVVSWLGEHAVVTPLDVDEFPTKARELRVRAMPTMMLFRGDDELARVTGYRDGDSLLSWLETSAQDDSNTPAKAAAPADDAVSSAKARLDGVRDLMNEGKLDEATAEFVWLWDNMVEQEPSLRGVRVSFMATDMERLADEHPPAKAAFAELRRREDIALKNGATSWDLLTDWLVLNEITGNEDATMMWAERVAERGNAEVAFGRVGNRIVSQAIGQQRWDVVALAVPDPFAAATEGLDRAKQMSAFDNSDPMTDISRLRYALTPAVTAALHAEDDGKSERALIEYLDEATGEEDAWRLAFISIAQDCGKLRDEHAAWVAAYNLEARYPNPWDVEPDLGS